MQESVREIHTELMSSTRHDLPSYGKFLLFHKSRIPSSLSKACYDLWQTRRFIIFTQHEMIANEQLSVLEWKKIY